MRLKALVFVATFLAAQTALAPNLVTLKPVEGNLPPFEAQFNPKELTIDKKAIFTKDKKSTDDSPVLEYDSSEPKTLQVELMFDTFETKEDVYAKYIARLEQLAAVDTKSKRPPLLTFTWGSSFPVFKGVIESLNVKYTLFLPDGTATRATANVSLKQADAVTTKKSNDDDDDKKN